MMVGDAWLTADEAEGHDNNISALTKDWKASEVTWDDAKSGDLWENSGGDYDNSSTTYTEDKEDGQWEEYDVTEIVKKIVSGEKENYGFLVQTWEHNAIERFYYASEYGDQEKRPKLEIRYDATPIAAPKAKVGSAITMSVSGEVYTLDLNRAGDYSVVITNLMGQEIYSSVAKGGVSHSIDMTAYARGVYFVAVRSNSLYSVQKVILK